MRCLAILVAAAGCGRLGFDGDSATARGASLTGAERIGMPPYALVATDTGFAAAWAEYPPGAPRIVLRLVELDLEGTIVRELELDTLTAPRQTLSLFPRADGWDVFHQHYDGYANIVYFARYDRSGVKLASHTLTGRPQFRVAAVPDGYVIGWATWGGARVVYFERLDGDGMPTGIVLRPAIATTNQDAVAVGWLGERLLIAYSDGPYMKETVRIGVVEPTTMTLESLGEVMPSPLRQSAVAFAADPSGGGALAFEQARATHVVAYDRGGALRWPAVTLAPANRRDPPVSSGAYVDGEFAFAIESDREATEQIDLWSIDGSGLAPSTAQVSESDVNYCCPAIAQSHGVVGVLYHGTPALTNGPVLRLLK